MDKKGLRWHKHTNEGNTPKPIKAIAFGVVKRYKQKKVVSFARTLAPAGRSFVELTKKVTQNSQKCYPKMLTADLKYATI